MIKKRLSNNDYISKNFLSMLKILSFGLLYLFGLYVVKLFLVSITKKYIFKSYRDLIIRDFYSKNLNLNEILKKGINSHCFENGLMDLFFNINENKLSAKDVAVSIKMSEINTKFDSKNNSDLINFSYYFINELRKRIKTDNFLKIYIKQLGKDYTYIETSILRNEIEDSLKDKKSIIKSYYNIFSNDNYSDLITIYFPAENNSYIDYSEENSVDVKMYLFNIPKGFFLMGLDYRFETSEWLKIASENRYKEFFNSSKMNNNSIWIK